MFKTNLTLISDYILNILKNYIHNIFYLLYLLKNTLIQLLKHNSIISGDYPVLKDLGITGTNIKTILPKYIYRFRSGGQFG